MQVAIAATSVSSGVLPVLQPWPARVPGNYRTILPMIDQHALYQHLKAWRNRAGMSQQRVANILNVDKSTIHRWEKGSRAVDLDDIERLAVIYGVDPIALLMAPNDIDLARKLTAAKIVLQNAHPDAADRWLATGSDIAGKAPT